MPGRIADAQRDWPLLFADLNDYDDDTISDLVVSYKAGLIDAFPKDQAMWRPPAEQRVALFMIRALRGSGEILVSALPTARATPR